ncbi:MFS transporter [Granulimonas faecalis]|uniref:MFS transporter n=1 Tax=Granulimonas faecalis TaxID=2894155 RepID=A0AAV5B3M4_9ACTN|nr:sugar MFS transporter [Granulimonas faecalis]GJM55697.1 MFS transporter [Granulimonas faecalis]
MAEPAPKATGPKDAVGERRGSKAVVAIALVTSLFFVWGLTMNLVNGLNSPMANYLELSATEASLLQVAYYGAYFIMAVPASLVARRYGYKGGVVLGLALFVVGSFITVPATNAASFALFLVSMFVVAAGASSLEANCNPYITKLGDERHEAMRLNLAQGFNGVGSIVGPLILAQILGVTVAAGNPGFDAAKVDFLANMRTVYIVIGVVLAVLLAVFVFVKLPVPPGDEADGSEVHDREASFARVVRRPHVALGVAAEFLYVGVQTIGMSLFSGIALDQWQGMTAAQAAMLLSVLSLLFTVGRFVSVPLLARFDAGKMLGVYMGAAAVLFLVCFLGLGPVSVVALILAFLFMSIGYPTVFSLTLRGLNGAAAKTCSSALVMSIVGGALVPLLAGALIDMTGSQTFAMIIAVPSLAFVAWYGFRGSRIGLEAS